MSEQEERILTAEDTFNFDCHENLPCFTHCCRDVNIYLTPYDVLRMRTALGMGSSEFLNQYTRSFLAKVTHIPVVQLLMNPDTLYCYFVTDSGCKIYNDRPWACRMYPLDLHPHKSGCYRIIAGAEKCFGLKENKTWTVGEWLASQGVGPYDEMERLYQSVLPAGFKPGSPMDAGLGKLLFLAYDTDIFLEMLKDSKFRRLHGIDEKEVEIACRDAEALLRLAFDYIREQLRELYPLT
ncbi:MAG TPA: YkgJ family cysteine cluster protein [Thermodesulforhabdus norvegica]|uniref:YkgJ family cysteine cluster protein n=1 Tax=Thermodesulforhabdus norvegica TaxID=39841 RepID=A0A7C1AWM4_9BACT|nr:YkgJ family cysteine cluster protein [Thermodesulforhabdus norvegica]